MQFTAAFNASGDFENGEVEDYYLLNTEALPIKWLDIKAFNSGKLHTVEWSFVDDSENITHFEIETMDIDLNINTIGDVAVMEGLDKYKFINDNPSYINGLQQYRIKAYRDTTIVSYSPWVVVSDNNLQDNSLTVYPNPFSRQFVISGLAGDAKINIINPIGKSIFYKHSFGSMEYVDA